MYFFDLDGTLLDSNGVWLEIDVAFLAGQGISPVPPEYTDYVTGHSFQDAAAYTKDYFHLSLSCEEIIAIWQQMALAAYAERLELKPGALDFLQRAARAQIRCALLTSCIPRLCRAALGRHGLDSMLERVFTTAELGLEKQDGALYRHVSELCGVAPADCVLFDDSPMCCRAAREAGWQVFGMADPLFAHRAAELAELCGPERFPFSFSQPLP